MRRFRSEFGAKSCAIRKTVSEKARGNPKAPWRFHTQIEFHLPNIMPHQTQSNLRNKESVHSPLEIEVRYFSSILSCTKNVIAGVARKQKQTVN